MKRNHSLSLSSGQSSRYLEFLSYLSLSPHICHVFTTDHRFDQSPSAPRTTPLVPFLHFPHDVAAHHACCQDLQKKLSSIFPCESLVPPPPPPLSCPPPLLLVASSPGPSPQFSSSSLGRSRLLRWSSCSSTFLHTTTTTTPYDLPLSFRTIPISYTEGFSLPSGISRDSYFSLTADLPQLRGLSLIRSFLPDILHVTSPGFLSFIVTHVYSRLLTRSVPLVLAYHTHLPALVHMYFWWLPGAVSLSWRYLRHLHNQADLTLVTSPQVKQQMERVGIQRVQVWQKGVDTKRFHPRHRCCSMRTRLSGGRPDSIVLLYVGRLSSEKNLELFQVLLDALPNCTLALVGGGPYTDSLREQWHGNDRVTFTGMLEGKDLSEAFASADIFVMPSFFETLGFVLLESMASGVPVVAYSAGGIPSVVEDGFTGLLVEPATHRLHRSLKKTTGGGDGKRRGSLSHGQQCDDEKNFVENVRGWRKLTAGTFVSQ
eukprot:GHVS01086293.1.p1 GENE.GHVS01086293.1~~GHVS01086293.1.p1  ORF type:complete len:485 (-),score=61.82 GHVS01086293.1:418-1872(-)